MSPPPLRKLIDVTGTRSCMDLSLRDDDRHHHPLLLIIYLYDPILQDATVLREDVKAYDCFELDTSSFLLHTFF